MKQNSDVKFGVLAFALSLVFGVVLGRGCYTPECPEKFVWSFPMRGHLDEANWVPWRTPQEIFEAAKEEAETYAYGRWIRIEDEAEAARKEAMRLRARNEGYADGFEAGYATARTK